MHELRWRVHGWGGVARARGCLLSGSWLLLLPCCHEAWWLWRTPAGPVRLVGGPVGMWPPPRPRMVQLRTAWRMWGGVG